MAIRTREFDAARYLNTPEALAEYVDAALETNDAAYIARSLGVIARAHGMTDVAKKAGLGRESLYKALGENSNPTFSTVLSVLDALGLRLSVDQAHSKLAPN